jgi:hypothetical protein
MNLARTAVVASLAGIVLIGCGSDNEFQTDGGGGTVKLFSQCDPATRSAGSSDTSPQVLEAISDLVPSDIQINCTDKYRFSINGQDVYFVFVAYGELQDCPSGCFSSSICAVVDQSGAALYSAVWNEADERPASIPPDCPELSDSATGDTLRDCQYQPSGYENPLTQTTEFEDFSAAESGQDGAWRFCF